MSGIKISAHLLSSHVYGSSRRLVVTRSRIAPCSPHGQPASVIVTEQKDTSTAQASFLFIQNP